MSWLSDLFRPKTAADYELPSPKIRIHLEDIVKVPGGILIKGLSPDTWITTVQDTNSQDPFLDNGMLCLLEPYKGDGSDLIVGDLVYYEIHAGGTLLFCALHRIQKISQDKYGWYCLTKGDNPVCRTDIYYVRAGDIKNLFRGVIN